MAESGKLYKNEEEIEIAIFDKSKKATIEVSLEKAKTYKKYDRLSLSDDFGGTAQLAQPYFIDYTENQKQRL